MERELVKKIEGTKKIFMTENSKGVEHFKKIEKSIMDLVKATTWVHDRIDNRGIENKTLLKKIGRLEERCDTLTGQVGVVLKPNLLVSYNTSSRLLP